MRAVIDTNVLLSALLWRGAPHALIACVRDGALGLIGSPALLAELAEVIRRPKFQGIVTRWDTSADELLADLRQLVELIDAPPLPVPVSRDPDDDAVLALALAARADLIVSGDRDLLTLGSYAGIPIVDVATAVAKISGQSADDP